MTYVLAIALGPVQDFIVAARRTRDLWFGSYLLSQASQAAASVLQGPAATLIFPTAQTLERSEEERGNVSNKLLATVEGSAEDVERLAGQALAAARARVLELSQKPLEIVEGAPKATAQIGDLLEGYWAAAEIKEGDYALARRMAERWLTARKNTRDFAPVTWGDNVPKSQLDGQRESVTGKVGKRQRLKLGLREAEELCAPGLVKRTGLRGDAAEARFMSTSHVAAQPFLTAVQNHPGVQEDWRSYISVLEELGVEVERSAGRVGGAKVLGQHDGRLLYASRLPELLEDLGPAEQRRASDALEGFLRKHRVSDETFGSLPPEPYYALFQADGDGMGSLIDAQSVRGKEAHSKLSDALSAFAGDAGQLVQQAGGSLIYAGGDDVLALLPLHTALSCASQIEEAYSSRLASFAAPRAPVSLSAGLVIAHFLTPLQESLKAVRDTEKAAKRLPGKAALCIGLYRRSGAPVVARGKWDELQHLLPGFVELYRAGQLPHKFAYNVRVLAGELGEDAPNELAALELQRILSRKRAERGSSGVDEVHQESLRKALGQLSKAPDEEAGEESAKKQERRQHTGLRRLSDLLVIAHTLARAQAQAATLRREVKA